MSFSSLIRKNMSLDNECLPQPAQCWGPVPTPPFGRTWEELMALALSEARVSAAQSEVPVGAVVVAPNGTILSAAHNGPQTLSDPTAHAEILALRAAARAFGNYRLEKCVLVVTLEPCFMCAGALVHARVAGVVYGARDKKAGAVESCLNALDLPFHNHRVWHMGGIAADACAALLQDFFLLKRNGTEGELVENILSSEKNSPNRF